MIRVLGGDAQVQLLVVLVCPHLHALVLPCLPSVPSSSCPLTQCPDLFQQPPTWLRSAQFSAASQLPSSLLPGKPAAAPKLQHAMTERHCTPQQPVPALHTASYMQHTQQLTC